MGECFQVVNVTKREAFSPHILGVAPSFTSLTDDPMVMGTLAGLLCGRWRGDRVLVLGDYARENAVSADILALAGCKEAQELCAKASTRWSKKDAATKAAWAVTPLRVDVRKGRTFSAIVNRSVPRYHQWGYFNIVNLTRNEYLTPAGFGDSHSADVFTKHGHRGGILSALALLLRARVPGEDSVRVGSAGSWAGDALSMCPRNEVPDGTACVDAQVRAMLSEHKLALFEPGAAGQIVRYARMR